MSMPVVCVFFWVFPFLMLFAQAFQDCVLCLLEWTECLGLVKEPLVGYIILT